MPLNHANRILCFYYVDVIVMVYSVQQPKAPHLVIIWKSGKLKQSPNALLLFGVSKSLR